MDARKGKGAAILLGVMTTLWLAVPASAAAPPTGRQDQPPQRQAQSTESELDPRMLADLELLRDLDLLRELDSLRGMTRMPATPTSRAGEEKPRP